eukprot:TRINITY_DN395_c0_g1_i3.p1 TRINITY_DN395_c0_g1~~TRINITY_DN395_c0_g1_i3.p1  ORF type:complete len:199 (-),score=51.67 TRINITY_DN395_c0_g1_i3:63-659(-)
MIKKGAFTPQTMHDQFNKKDLDKFASDHSLPKTAKKSELIKIILDYLDGKMPTKPARRKKFSLTGSRKRRRVSSPERGEPSRKKTKTSKHQSKAPADSTSDSGAGADTAGDDSGGGAGAGTAAGTDTGASTSTGAGDAAGAATSETSTGASEGGNGGSASESGGARGEGDGSAAASAGGSKEGTPPHQEEAPVFSQSK